jgi:POT family proton-dependent oligopeptide transporter
MENPMQHDPSGIPGALGLGKWTATRVYCIFYVFYYTTPLFVATLADGFLGRFTTLVISIIVYCLGCVALTVSSSTDKLSEGWGLPGLAIAMILIGIGGGGFRVVIVPFMIDQYDKTRPKIVTTKNGQLFITDYDMTVQFICNIYYW